jgi:hypothetical protein
MTRSRSTLGRVRVLVDIHPIPALEHTIARTFDYFPTLILLSHNSAFFCRWKGERMVPSTLVIESRTLSLSSVFGPPKVSHFTPYKIQGYLGKPRSGTTDPNYWLLPL